ncbi:nicotinate-nucleotide--dimethylbenzimidazole phosphoribosyltransferase [Paludibaculum fermentans]|uniref:Nicotinate-nucleotide--dimethylbenzimidazole phosphoribosyltransferase n=1 Tax=Paludibaculum fermentans TaxID=1473598 RepID=A0A7S7NUZ1_PALFE|nr:nicotinate-nucleotide--dimethylbenzimidazole phosphoribosyltransferase [Paludibaculum fermentans]QOY90288.1 nicotinate-nucleotide--dimethylbenzimidazole phosphoribosyltransferase [Paludibaculum fermentans]
MDRIRPLLDPAVATAISERWSALTKNSGGLGQLEALVVHYGLIHGTGTPQIQRKGLYVFSADHGIVQEGISAEAQDGTALLARQFLRGGSAAQVICRQARIEPVLVDMGSLKGGEPGALNYRIASGTANSCRGSAMTEAQVNAALETGLQLAEDAAGRFDVVGLGQIGVGGSAAASAMLSAMGGRDASETTGRGEVLDDATLNRKVQAVRTAVTRNQTELLSPQGTLRSLGGFEIAAMTGFIIGAAARRLPVVIDGFVAGAAAMTARGLAPDCLDAVMFSHLSPDRAHAILLRFLSVEPVLDFRLRESAGLGAALAIQLLETSVRLYQEISLPEEE